MSFLLRILPAAAGGFRSAVSHRFIRRDAWSEHFALDGVRVVGKSTIGRTTVHLLDLNDADRVRVREGLARLGQWP